MDDALLLDTCALLWLASGSDRLSAEARDRIRRAPEVYYSPISAWEIAQKVAHGELTLPDPPLAWMEGLTERYQLTAIPLSLPVFVKSTELPPHHKDPADRFIIATALIRGIPVVTTDRRYKDYGGETLS